MKVLHGIDIASVSRFRETLEKQGERFLSRVFTDDERAYCQPKRMREEHYAARFAAKEAFCKAVSPVFKIARLKDIEVCKEPSGKPYIKIAPALQKKLRFNSRCRIELSLAHEREMAMASIVIVLP